MLFVCGFCENVLYLQKKIKGIHISLKNGQTNFLIKPTDFLTKN